MRQGPVVGLPPERPPAPTRGRDLGAGRSGILAGRSVRHRLRWVDEPAVVVVGYDRAELLDIASVTSTLDVANLLGAAPGYRVHLVAPGAGP